MASLLEGVNIGPLDPDRTQEFGQIAGSNRAKKLIKEHRAAFPPKLVAALSKPRQPERSKGLDLDEVRDAAEATIPDGRELEGFTITGAAVRGTEGEEQVVSYTFRIASGRTGKGYVAYDRESFPRSIEKGEELLRIAEAKKQGLPWSGNPQGVPQAAPQGDGSDAPLLSKEDTLKLVLTVQQLQRQVEQLTAAQGGDGSQEHTGDGEAQGAQEPLAEPFEGYDGLNADRVLAYVKEHPDVAAAVVAYERANEGRSTLISKAEAVADRHEGQQTQAG